MSSEAEQARLSFANSKNILQSASDATRNTSHKAPRDQEAIDAARRVVTNAQRLQELVDNGGDLDQIDRLARFIGAEALKIQSATLKVRARLRSPVEAAKLDVK